jgi:hypothetical protein
VRIRHRCFGSICVSVADAQVLTYETTPTLVIDYTQIVTCAFVMLGRLKILTPIAGSRVHYPADNSRKSLDCSFGPSGMKRVATLGHRLTPDWQLATYICQSRLHFLFWSNSRKQRMLFRLLCLQDFPAVRRLNRPRVVRIQLGECSQLARRKGSCRLQDEPGDIFRARGRRQRTRESVVAKIKG